MSISDLDLIDHYIDTCHQYGGSLSLHKVLHEVKHFFTSIGKKKKSKPDKYEQEFNEAEEKNRQRQQYRSQQQQEADDKYYEEQRKKYNDNYDRQQNQNQNQNQNNNSINAQHYETLGLSPNADLNEVKKAYRNLSRQHHPDRGGDPEMMKHINHAYETITGKGLKNRKCKCKYCQCYKKKYRGGGMCNSNLSSWGINIEDGMNEKEKYLWKIMTDPKINTKKKFKQTFLILFDRNEYFFMKYDNELNNIYESLP